jgi:NhaA family Na+:H+ antiporter
LSLGIIGGLVLGKPLGITLFSWIAVKLGIADLPAEVTWPQLFSASWLAGIGFTMALFIANAAFSDPILLDVAKFSILIASLLASVIGFGLLLLTTSTHRDVSQMEQESATAQVQA